ncbi:MAG TPA: TetR/AcrR family transcriptional regulator [Acidimicrobiales bacterium]|nr:TetR/AcrR family transcriptional regulator [Acidimicrobiales bacterium]
MVHPGGGVTRPSTRAAAGVDDRLLPGEVSRPEPATPRSARIGQIVEAARRLLEDEGPDSLTMRRLADELGMQAPSLYKHFPGKAGVELALIEDALSDIGEVSHQAIHRPGSEGRLMALLDAYRRHGVSHPNLYRLATGGPLVRDRLPAGLEEWAGNPWFVVTGDPSLSQALWSFAHGMVILELDGRYPPDSDLDATWRSGAVAFDRVVGAG